MAHRASIIATISIDKNLEDLSVNRLIAGVNPEILLGLWVDLCPDTLSEV